MLLRNVTMIMILLSIISVRSLADELDSIAQLYVDSYAVVDISHYDDDGISDTLLAKADRAQYMRPYKILWGDNTHGVSKHVTEFHYPEKAYLNLSTAPIDRNNDNLQDIMFFIFGSYLDIENRRVSVEKTVTIYGQNALKNITDINLMDLVQTSTSPYHYTVMDNCDGIGKSNIDHTTHLTQYELTPTSVVITPQYKEKLEKELRNISLNLSPNPASEYAILEISDESKHDFEINVVDMKGMTIATYEVTSKSSNTKVNIPLEKYSSGSYNVVVKCNNVKVDVLQLVVIK